METTTENNRLIAEFMGLTNPFELPQHGTLRPNGDFKTEFTESQLKYHSSWDWLMPVVEKIENLGFEFFVVESRCKIAHNTDKSIETIIGFEIIGTKIEAVYKAVLDFIDWHNQHQNDSGRDKQI